MLKMIYSSLGVERVCEDVYTFQSPVGPNSGRHPAPYFPDGVCCFLHENAFTVRQNVKGWRKVGEGLALNDTCGIR